MIMGVICVLIGYLVIALIIFAVLDYFETKKNIFSVEELIFVSILWIFILAGLILVMPFYIINKLIKRRIGYEELY